MNLFTSIFGRKPRPQSARKRPRRSLSMSFAALESRALLTIMGPVAVPTSASLVSAFVNGQGTPAPMIPIQSSTPINFGDSNSTGGGDWTAGPGSPGEPPHYDRVRNHVALSEADATINGENTSEFALADAGVSEVLVREGNQIQTLGAAQGIDQPQSVILTDLNPSGPGGTNSNPDLIVVNSGGDNILVFPELPNGRFGPAINGTSGFEVGDDPMSVSVADVNGDGVPDLLIANLGSNTVSILQGTDQTGSWGLGAVQTIPVGTPTSNTAPVKALFKDVTGDGIGDLFVLNSGSNNVYVYPGIGNGDFDLTDPDIFDVGKDPNDMLFGQFDRRPQLDLVTINSGSDDLTLIDGILTPDPTIQTISSGGVMPDAAFTFAGDNGMTNLVVANSGDGRMAVLQAGNSGLQIAGILTQANLPDPTSLIPGSSDGSGIAFFAATAGQDAAEILRFDLGVGSTYLPTPVSGSGSDGSDDDLVAGLVAYGESPLELIAVYWAGGSDQAVLSDETGVRELTSVTALYTPNAGQGNDVSTTTAEVKGSVDPTDPNLAGTLQAAPPEVNNWVFGTDGKLGTPQTSVDALAIRDRVLIDRERSLDQVASLDFPSVETIDDPDTLSHEGVIGEAIRIRGELFDAPPNLKEDDASAPSLPRLDPPRPAENLDTSALEGRFETIPLLSTVVLFSTRMILKATPPRPPSFRTGPGFRLTPGKPEAGPPL